MKLGDTITLKCGFCHEDHKFRVIEMRPKNSRIGYAGQSLCQAHSTIGPKCAEACFQWTKPE